MTFINLEVNLPDRYGLTSIQRFWTGEWVVCLHIARPGERLGEAYALGQHADINEAAKLAMERCEQKLEMQQRLLTPPMEILSGIKFNL